MNRNVYYLGDYEAYSITDWANEIANIEGIKIPHVPYFASDGWDMWGIV